MKTIEVLTIIGFVALAFGYISLTVYAILDIIWALKIKKKHVRFNILQHLDLETYAWAILTLSIIIFLVS